MRLRHATALSAPTALLIAPRVAHATDMSGLAVIVVGLFVGVPAAVLLLILLIVAIAASSSASRAKWHAVYATALTIAAPLLALAYPLSMVFIGGKPDFLVLSFVFNLPVLVLGMIALVFARRLAHKSA